MFMHIHMHKLSHAWCILRECSWQWHAYSSSSRTMRRCLSAHSLSSPHQGVLSPSEYISWGFSHDSWCQLKSAATMLLWHAWLHVLQMPTIFVISPCWSSLETATTITLSLHFWAYLARCVWHKFCLARQACLEHYKRDVCCLAVEDGDWYAVLHPSCEHVNTMHEHMLNICSTIGSTADASWTP